MKKVVLTLLCIFVAPLSSPSLLAYSQSDIVAYEITNKLIESYSDKYQYIKISLIKIANQYRDKDQKIVKTIEKIIELMAYNFEPEAISSAKKTELAKCIAKNWYIMYWANWCEHCKEQKSYFGEEAFRYLSYVECTIETEKCDREWISAYPTLKSNNWFEEIGTKTLFLLWQITSCPL